jgi:hypothetical protein
LFPEKPEVSGSSRRLGFFADKLTSSLSGTAKDTSASLKNSLHPSLLLHPHSHSRAESGSTTSSVLSPGAMSTSSNFLPRNHILLHPRLAYLVNSMLTGFTHRHEGFIPYI